MTFTPLPTYEEYLREQRALATVTIVNYVRFAHAFLEDRFGAGAVKLYGLSAADVGWRWSCGSSSNWTASGALGCAPRARARRG